MATETAVAVSDEFNERLKITAERNTVSDDLPRPFLEFSRTVQQQSILRAEITAAYRRPEVECLPRLISDAALPQTDSDAAEALARKLVLTLREKNRQGGGGVEGLIQEYSLSSQEGVALMCLAEALLRIPDRATRDSLIRDKISTGDWQSHAGRSQSVFVNAATWGLVVTGKLTANSTESGLSSVLSRLIAKGGEPLIRKGVDIAMRMMGEQFVAGQTIGEAIANSRKWEAKGFRYSYDMLGEAAMTAEDADFYYNTYSQAIHGIGKAARGCGIYEGPGISVKLSALHPRYSRAQLGRVTRELLPRLKNLAVAARSYDIGLNIDAEEADRLELSLDLLEALCFDPDLAGWNGIGFVVQAYQKRCSYVIDWLIDLARRSRHRLMVRLVKGAYWDTEIKRAQVDGLEGYPVFTRKVHTDVSYLAGAKKLLNAPDAIFPQFATHNAQTLATVMQMAGGNYYAGQYEFQCLHGMGEPLYEEVTGRNTLNRPCRIYAPVGTHESLLAYLVRRLLENGANTSFVNKIGDESVTVDALIADPVKAARSIEPMGTQHPEITDPRDIFGPSRANSAGIDLSNEQRLATLSVELLSSADIVHKATPLIGETERNGDARPVLNPSDHRDIVGSVVDATLDDVDKAFAQAVASAPLWAATPPQERAAALVRGADLLQARMPLLVGILVREAGKSLPNAIGEVREGIDFLRYYSAQVHADAGIGSRSPLGPVVCISPWNFPLAIFTGQIAAALAAGNPVVAKPAEETPLIAAEVVRVLREAGIPGGVLQFLPGAGDIGAALVADTRTRGVIFTGSTEVARLIQSQLAERLTPQGQPIPLIAETGGQNACIVDSSALAEQVVADVIASAFDSAGQRCSALRVLCLQDEVASRVLKMLTGAMRELVIGNPGQLSTDVGPVITAEARHAISAHVDEMRAKGHRIDQLPLPEATRHGTFVAPALIEIDSIVDLKREVFGPVLHVLRYKRAELDALMDAIKGTGYGLTFGLHTRIDETIDCVVRRVPAGNIYINRNMIGAVVGVQPFGGHGLSGTGPKAGGPLYLNRLSAKVSERLGIEAPAVAPAEPAVSYRGYLAAIGKSSVAERVTQYIRRSALGFTCELPGPAGERNVYGQAPRGSIAALAHTADGILMQIGAILATGNVAVIEANNPAAEKLSVLPALVASRIITVGDWHEADSLAGILFEGSSDELMSVQKSAAALNGPILLVLAASAAGLASGEEDYDLDFLLSETTVSTNTSAAGGNASLMAIG